MCGSAEIAFNTFQLGLTNLSKEPDVILPKDCYVVVDAWQSISNAPISDTGYHDLLVDKSKHENIDAASPFSRISDYGLVPPSIFSLPSLALTALTGQSVLSSVEIRRATDELIDIFLKDSELENRYRLALHDRHIRSDRLARNFKRLLMLFSRNLKEEACDSVDVELANFVASNAGLVATKMHQTLQAGVLDTPSEEDQMSQAVTKPMIDTGLLDEDEILNDTFQADVAHQSEDGNEEKFAALVAQGRSFIELSDAFQKLRKDFRNFVSPQTHSTFSGLPASSDESTIASNKTIYSSHNWSAIQKMYCFIIGMLSCLGLIEPALKQHHQRVRWRNVCATTAA
jgi:hypothetical protein